ncbi:MAG: glycosyltransferase [Alphaproteobacteria bacterium]
MMGPKRILIATLGSLGDLYPYIALGTGLKKRGHSVTIATSTEHRQRTEAAGLEWRRMRPEAPNDPDLYAKVMNPKTGQDYMFRHLLSPAVKDSYADLREAAKDTDFLISTPISYAAPMLAEKKGIPWASALLQPMIFVSAYDPPVLPQAQKVTGFLRRFGRLYGVPLRALGPLITRDWSAPMRELRRELGLPEGLDPLLEGQHSPRLVLAMFPHALAQKQPDWPKQAEITGTLFWDGTEAEQQIQPELERFLNAGPAPVVFTLGSAAVNTAGNFYAESLSAVRALRCRAVLLIGSDPANRAQLPENLSEDIIALPYAPHAQVFPRAAAIVHQGGVGTLSQAMRAGKPMLVVPFSHDQPDNAARVTRLGIARTLTPDKYRTASAARELGLLLGDRTIQAAAADIGEKVRAEDGVNRACDLVEASLA